jgi:hypothetical protein
MRERIALRIAKRFVHNKYSSLSGCHIEVALEHDGQRRKSWSFGVHIDKEDSLYQPDASNELVGYIHSDGRVEGLY